MSISTRRVLKHAAAGLLPVFALCPTGGCSPPASEGSVEQPPAVSAPRRWTPPNLSTTAYESSPTFSPDSSEVFFMRADRSFHHFRLLHSACVDGRWSVPREPAFAAPAAMDDGDPFVARDGSTLFFISTRHRFAEVHNEDFDIFMVKRTATGSWGPPQRLPEPVNSNDSELLPRTDRAGNLYFGSSRPGGLGGSDIYRSVEKPDGSWDVVNVESVNTPANEYEADVSEDGTQLAVVSDKEARSRVYLYRAAGTGWKEVGRVRAREEVFQVGPRFSPDGERLLFAQDTGPDSGEIFVVDLADRPDSLWPPRCQAGTSRP